MPPTTVNTGPNCDSNLMRQVMNDHRAPHMPFTSTVPGYDPTDVTFVMVRNPPCLPSMSDLVAIQRGHAGQHILRVDPRSHQLYAW